MSKIHHLVHILHDPIRSCSRLNIHTADRSIRCGPDGGHVVVNPHPSVSVVTIGIVEACSSVEWPLLMPQQHSKSVCLWIRQGPQQKAVYQTEHHRVNTDAESQRGDDRQGVSGISAQLAQREAKILTPSPHQNSLSVRSSRSAVNPAECGRCYRCATCQKE